MRVRVNGVVLYFDVEGAGLRAEGAAMVPKPTLLLLHGGPGADHTLYKPDFSALADVAQVIYLDHRGNGRSDRGTEDTWHLAQWADDVLEFCQVLGIVKPVVYGASFGGLVAMAYATRHPEHPGKLVLVSTATCMASHARAKVEMFRRLGGDRLANLAHRRFVERDTSAEVLRAWLEQAVPLYTQAPLDPDVWKRIVSNPAVTAWFNRPGGEAQSFDLGTDLHRIQCPTLLMGGTLDPMLPIECQRDIAAALGAHMPHLLTYREFEHCGHGVVPDRPLEAMQLVRDFLQADPSTPPAGR